MSPIKLKFWFIFCNFFCKSGIWRHQRTIHRSHMDPTGTRWYYLNAKNMTSKTWLWRHWIFEVQLYFGSALRRSQERSRRWSGRCGRHRWRRWDIRGRYRTPPHTRPSQSDTWRPRNQVRTRTGRRLRDLCTIRRWDMAQAHTRWCWLAKTDKALNNCHGYYEWNKIANIALADIKNSSEIYKRLQAYSRSCRRCILAYTRTCTRWFHQCTRRHSGTAEADTRWCSL